MESKKRLILVGLATVLTNTIIKQFTKKEPLAGKKSRRNVLILWVVLVGHPVLIQYIFVFRDINIGRIFTAMALSPITRGVDGLVSVLHRDFRILSLLSIATNFMIAILNLYLFLVYGYLIFKIIMWLVSKLGVKADKGLSKINQLLEYEAVENVKEDCDKFISLFVEAMMLTFIITCALIFISFIYSGESQSFLPLHPWVFSPILYNIIPVLMFICSKTSSSSPWDKRKIEQEKIKQEFVKIAGIFVLFIGVVSLGFNIHKEHSYRQELNEMLSYLSDELELFIYVGENNFPEDELEELIRIFRDPEFDMEGIIVIYELALRSSGSEAHEVIQVLSEEFVEHLLEKAEAFIEGELDWREVGFDLIDNPLHNSSRRAQLFVFLELLEPHRGNIQSRNFDLDDFADYFHGMLFYMEERFRVTNAGTMKGFASTHDRSVGTNQNYSNWRQIQFDISLNRPVSAVETPTGVVRLDGGMETQRSILRLAGLSYYLGVSQDELNEIGINLDHPRNDDLRSYLVNSNDSQGDHVAFEHRVHEVIMDNLDLFPEIEDLHFVDDRLMLDRLPLDVLERAIELNKDLNY